MIKSTTGMRRNIHCECLSVLIMVMTILLIPITVYADFANEIKLLASGGAANDEFGYSVSISGDTAIMGARRDDGFGSAYIYTRNPSTGVWSLQSKLFPSTGRDANEQFGASVSISGDTAIIGVPLDNDIGQFSGSAYVYVRDPATGIWSEQQKLLASDGAASNAFGTSVSLSGNTAIVGSPSNTYDGFRTGAAYVYVRDPATGIWSEQQKLLATGITANDSFFAISVFIEGDRAIVGAPREDITTTDAGAAYVFVRDTGTGVWSQEQKLLSSDGAFIDYFGSSVVINNDTALIGATNDDDNGTDSGSAYIFVRDPATGVWAEQQKLIASDGELFDYMGGAVALLGDTVIVGAISGGSADSGSAYVFLRDPTTDIWTEDQILVASDGTLADEFSYSISISGNTLIVGTPGELFRRGAIYLYTSLSSTLPDITVADSVTPNNDLQIPFGDVTEMTTSDQSITVTNDGNADLVLGSIAVTNPVVAPFSILNDNCSAQTLTPAANCNFTVRFSPTSIGAFNNSFDIPSDDPDENPVTFSVNGNGIGVPTPDISVTDEVAPVNDLQVPFGNVTEMTTAEQIITVSNDGNADLVMGNVAMVDPLAAPFSIISDNCSTQTITPAASCTFTVQFEPTSTGAFNDTLDIPSNDSDEASVTLAVSGTGTATPVPDVTVTDAIVPVDDLQIPFADLTIAGISDQTVTISNNGNADLVMGNIAQVNTLGAPFSVINDNCSGQTISVAADCTFDVRFAPTVAGVFSDSFDVPSNDPDESSVTVNVSGTGLAGVNNPPSSPNLISPADGQQGLSTNVTLEWQPSTDPDGDVVSYDVYNCMDSDPVNNCTRLAEVASLNTGLGNGVYVAGLGLGGGIMILGITLTGGIRSRRQTAFLVALLVITSMLGSCGGNDGTGNKTYTVSGLDTGSTYYWAVVANDGNGGETSSVVRSYTTQ